MQAGLVLALLGALAQPPTAASVQGRVLDVVLHIPVPSAEVVLEGAAGRRRAFTGSDGTFRFDDVSAGSWTLRAERSGYGGRSVEIRVSGPAVVDVQLGLDLEPLVVAELSIRVPRTVVREGNVRAAPAEVVPRLARTGLVRGGSPMAELGLAGLARDVRGQDPGDPSDLLYVRGSSLDLKLVLLDGAPVYTPFHVGGLLEPLEASTLSAARLHVGAAPARLNGGLSYILDLRTRSPDLERGGTSGAVDLLSARTMVEMPFGESFGVLAQGRAASGKVTEALFGHVMGYGYRDGLVRAEWLVDEASRIRVTAFGNDERVELGAGLHDAAWGSGAVTASWTRVLANGQLDIGGAASRASGTIPRNTGLLDDLESRSARLRVFADLRRQLGNHGLALGTSVEREELRELAGPLSSDARITTFSGYGEVDVRASDEVRLRGGLRVEVDQTGDLRPAPRLGATWLLGERTELSVTAGSYHQYVRNRGTGSQPEPLRLTAARATHFALALDQEVNASTRLELQGFVKRFTNLPSENGAEAFTSGFDLWAYREGAVLTAWLGYSLSWLWSQSPSSGVSQRFTGNQVLSLGLRGRIATGTYADLALTYGSGLPLTGIDIGYATAVDAVSPEGLENSGSSNLRPQAGSLVRVDARLARTLLFERGDRRISLTPYLKLINALDRRDALFFYDDDDDPDNGGRPLAALPFLPMLGIEWKF